MKIRQILNYLTRGNNIEMLPCACGKPSNHIRFLDVKEYLCCECYVKEGNPPADWHPVCMATYHALKEKSVV